MNGLVQKDLKIKGGEPRLSLRKEQKRVTYERLLSAAKELFELSSNEEITIEQIARRAGTNRTTFYLHFEDKADIAFKLRKQYLEGDINSIKRFLMKEGGVSRDDIRKWIKHRTKFIRKHRVMIKLGTESLNKNPEHMQEFLTQINEVIEIGFKSFLDNFETEEREFVFAELYLCAVTLNRYLYITIIQELKFPINKTYDVMVELLFKILSLKPGKY